MDRANGHVWRMGLVPLIPRLQTFVENCSTTGTLILRTTVVRNTYFNIPYPLVRESDVRIRILPFSCKGVERTEILLAKLNFIYTI